MNLNILKSNDTAQERIQRKRELIERIKKIGLELGILNREKTILEQGLKDDSNAIRGYTEERLKQFPSEKRRRDEMSASIDQAKDKLAKLSQKLAELTAERQQIEKVEIPACFQETVLDEVLVHQGVLNGMRLDAKRLEDAIETQRQVITQTEATVSTPQDRKALRAAILADIAIGQAKQKDLDDLDQEIKREHEAHLDSRAKADPIINQATQTITGLEAKLSDQQRKIAWKERDTPMILEQYLMSQISQAGAVYISQALALKEAFCKLIALDTLLKDATGVTLNVVSYNLTIPLPKLEECKEFSDYENSDLLFTTRAAGPGNDIYRAFVNAERERLTGEGLESL